MPRFLAEMMVKKRLGKLFKTTAKLVLLVGLGVAAWYGYQAYSPVEEDDGLGSLPVAVAETRDITVSVQATGVLRPIKIVEIKSKASGEILHMPVEMGDVVAAGDLIAQIDTEILDQELKQVQADYESAVVRLDIARSQYERAQSLFAQDLISEDALENNQQSYTSAEAQMLRAEASLDLAKERLADATVRAPSAGTIINKTVEEGQIIASSTNNVSGGTTLVQMADLSQMEVRTLVDEVDIGQVRAGLAVDSKVEAFADERFEGEVVKIEPLAEIQQSVTTFPVLSRIDNSSGKLLPGMNADVSIIVHRKPGVLTVPNEAVRTPSDAAEVQRMLGLVADTGTDRSGGGRGGGGGQRGGEGFEGRDGGSAGAGDGAAGRGGSDAGRGGRAGGEGRGDERGGSEGRRGSVGGAPGNGDRGGSSAGERGSGAGGTDMRARFEAMDPAQRARMFAAMREAREATDRDPFGIAGRREDAVVFVYDAQGLLATREIVAGARDWEHTEILEGLAPGDEVLLLPSTSLLRSQDRLRSWARGRSGVPGIGGGGGPPPGVGRRGR